MLVLSRRPGEKLVFPDIGATLEVLSVKGNATRLGILAPSAIKVLREELIPSVEKACTEASGGKLSHAVRNDLNSLGLALHLMERQLALGNADAAQVTFGKVQEQLEKLKQSVFPQLPAAPTHAQLRRALLIEDNINECELLAGILRIEGFDVATAGDGCDAMDYLAHHERPDVVLLDMVMPRCDGPTTIRAIRRDPGLNALRVYAISGTSPERLGIPVGPAGVDRWFQKPINPEMLVREISRELVSA